MTKLRNIGYLQFGSKIRQSFAGGITSLTPPLSLSPLWISWTGNEGVREGAQFLYLGGACRPLPGGRDACRPSTGRQVPAARQGGQAPARGLRAKKNMFIYM